jgi:hypothetical protein
MVSLQCVATLLALAVPSAASADVFGPISLLSASPFQQAEYAHDPAISSNGQYVAFDGSVGGVSGVWRRENRPGGALEQVAGGGSELPSISQNGQYVSFTTDEGARLGQITNGQLSSPLAETPNVYVRDMSKAPNEAGAFTLASNLTYEYPGSEGQASQEREEKEYGAMAAGRSALDAAGEKVVFVTTAASNLDGLKTPPLQVAVHDLETGKTEIVSTADDPATGAPAIDQTTGLPEPVPTITEGSSAYGAVYTRGGVPPRFELPSPYTLPGGVGASISADGTTVAWMGQDIGEQALMLPGEGSSITGKYNEPLWRRIAAGEQAPIRRVTGGSDPTSAPCLASGERAPAEGQPSLSEPCQGPFATGGTGTWNGAGQDYLIPQLSGNGEEVAFVASAPLVSQGSDFGTGAETRSSDLYVADMREGLSRVQALRQLTELAGGNETDISTDAPILDYGVSPEGTQVAFTTKRTVFPLGSLTYVSEPAVVPGLAELFDVDLANDTLTRVTHGYEGGAAEHPHEEADVEEPYKIPDDGALSPSFSYGGATLAFSSTASNLVYGDGNTPAIGTNEFDGSDVFAVNRVLFNPEPSPQYVSGAPSVAVTPTWGIGATAVSLGDGNVLLYVNLPGQGTLSAHVSSSVPTRTTRIARRARRGQKASRERALTTVAERTVASTTSHVHSGAGLTTLLLSLAPSYRALAAQRGGLSGTATVTFTAAGHPALRQSIVVTFVLATPAHVARRAKKARVAPKRKGHKGR